MSDEQLYSYDDYYLLDAEFDTVVSEAMSDISDYLPQEFAAVDEWVS